MKMRLVLLWLCAWIVSCQHAPALRSSPTPAPHHQPSRPDAASVLVSPTADDQGDDPLVAAAEHAAPLPRGPYVFLGGQLLPPAAAADAAPPIAFLGPVRLELVSVHAAGEGYVVRMPWQAETRQALVPLSSARPGLCLRRPLVFRQRALRLELQEGAFVYVFRIEGDTAWVGPSSHTPAWQQRVPRASLSAEACAAEQMPWAPPRWPRTLGPTPTQPPCLLASPNPQAASVRLPAGLPLWRRRQRDDGWWQVQAWMPPWHWRGWLPAAETPAPIETWQLRQALQVGSWLPADLPADTRVVRALGLGSFALLPWQGGHLLLSLPLTEAQVNDAALPWWGDAAALSLWWRQWSDASCAAPATPH